MRQALAFVICSAFAGCSWIYNPNNLPGAPGEAGIDAPSDAEVILDADPTMLVVNSVEPPTFHEGQGDFGSPPALIVLAGHQMIDNQTIVELIPTMGLPAGATMPELGTPVVAKNGNWIAVPVTAHVDPMLARGQNVVFDIRVTESIPDKPGVTATSTLAGQLTLIGLNELTTGTSIDTTKLDPLYSKVALAANATFTGAARAIVHAVSSISVQGLTATGIMGGVAGYDKQFVGGCAGGAPGTVGDCGGGAFGTGTSLLNAGGGGGGGFATDGGKGLGMGGGAAGVKTGDDAIVTYVGTSNRTPNRSPGGGGGGTVAGLFTGGAGGGGGGTIELTAEGDVTTGAITADGGAGATASAGGGGGAGGIVMLRAGHTLSTSAMISVSGGKGGVVSGKEGGNGAGGRIRWDAVVGSAPAVKPPVDASLPPTLHRGPAFVLDDHLFRTPVVRIAINGNSSDKLTVSATNYALTGPVVYPGSQITISEAGSASFLQTLQQGLTQLCVTLDGGMQGTSEADKCVFVAFLP